MERQLRHPHVVVVLRVHEDFVEVERTRSKLLAAVDERPARAAVGRPIQTALRALRFDLRVHDLRVRLRDVHPHLADEIVGESRARARPVVAAVGRLVDAAFGRRTAADDRPRPALPAPGARVHLVGACPVDRDRHGAGLIVDEEHLLPRPAAVFRAVHAALGSPSERVADRRDERDVRVLRVHLHLADLADVLQPGELPRSARVRGPVHAAPEDHVRPDCLAARPDVDDVRVGIGDVDCANRSGRHLAVGDRRPRDAVVPGLPDAAAGRAHVEHAGLRAHAGRRRRAAAAVRPDRSPPQILIGLRIDDGVRARLGNRASRGATVPEHDERQRRAGEQYQLSHDGSPCWCAILAPARSDQIVTGARLPPSLKLRRTAEALAEAGQPSDLGSPERLALQQCEPSGPPDIAGLRPACGDLFHRLFGPFRLAGRSEDRPCT